jgi:hypothetical protein
LRLPLAANLLRTYSIDPRKTGPSSSRRRGFSTSIGAPPERSAYTRLPARCPPPHTAAAQPLARWIDHRRLIRRHHSPGETKTSISVPSTDCSGSAALHSRVRPLVLDWPGLPLSFLQVR